MGESKRRSGVERCDRRAIDARDARQSRPVRGLELTIELREVIARGDEQVPVHPGEVAIDLLVPHDAFDLVDGRTHGSAPPDGRLLAMQPFELIEAIVQRAHEMRRCPARLATGCRTVVHHDRALALQREQVCGCEPRDACAHDADVRMCVQEQRRLVTALSRAHPNRSRAAVVGHSLPARRANPPPRPSCHRRQMPSASRKTTNRQIAPGHSTGSRISHSVACFRLWRSSRLSIPSRPLHEALGPAISREGGWTAHFHRPCPGDAGIILGLHRHQRVGCAHAIFVTDPSSVVGFFQSNSAWNGWCPYGHHGEDAGCNQREDCFMHGAALVETSGCIGGASPRLGASWRPRMIVTG